MKVKGEKTARDRLYGQPFGFDRNRTGNILIISQMLYQLSYEVTLNPHCPTSESAKKTGHGVSPM
jgi:hypothetical protein